MTQQQQPEYWIFNAEQIATIQKALNAAVTPATTKEETQCICHAHRIILDAPCSRPHTPAPEPHTVEHMQSAYAHGKMDGERTATLATLDELGKVLNSRIAKMEILDANNPTPLRKGILLAYRDVEEWERQRRAESLRQSTTAAQEERK